MNGGIVGQLLQQTYHGPVFGRGASFGDVTNERMRAIEQQVKQIAELLARDLYKSLQKAFPELADDALHARVMAILPKAACFCPALTAGELPGDSNSKLLSLTALAISDMYAADESTDRDDQAMLLAIERFSGDTPSVPAEQTGRVVARQSLLKHMQNTIEQFALSEDAPLVLECYSELVLHNEARLHRLSSAYRLLAGDDQQRFLSKHAQLLARLMVADAGFQSVTASLYTLYRRQDPMLPALSVVHTDPEIIKLLQLCNAVARVADERGDWWMDAGNNPAKGVFSINPFNQYHPEFVRTLCELADIRDAATIREIQSAFKQFHTDDEQSRQQNGKLVTDIFFAHARTTIQNLPVDFRQKYKRYIILCMRVLEISHVNMMGDLALAA